MVAHASLTGTELHEPKGAASAVAGEVYIADGAGSGSWDVLTHTSAPVGSLIGAVSSNSSVYSGTTVAIPYDNTIPQITEGVQVLSVTYTPLSATSLLLIEGIVHAEAPPAVGWSVGLFRDAVANALYAGHSPGQTYVGTNSVPFKHVMTSGSTSAITFRVRAGPVSGTLYVNGTSSAPRFGGVHLSSITVKEIKV